MFRKLLLISLLLFSIVLPILRPGASYADSGACSVSIQPTTITPNSTGLFQFLVTNNGADPIQWVDITAPSSGDYTIQSAGSNDWNGPVSAGPSEAMFSQGEIDDGQTATFNISFGTVNSQESAESWGVQASGDPNGASPFVCSGDTSTTISGQAPVTTPPNIYNISVVNLSATSVEIDWVTDTDSTSQVNYGSDDTYGSSSTLDSTLTTTHEVTLGGLETDTGYHYQVASTDAYGNQGFSGDNTFLTVAPPPTSTNTPTVSTTTQSHATTQPPASFVVTNPSDKTPPTISITTTLPKVVKAIPTISGTAGDDTAVALVQYSTDGGVDWLPVNTASNLGTKQVNFSFTPINLDDGNYTIVARAINVGGEVTDTAPVVVVVDTMPPQVGGSVVAVGPQVLLPNSQGVIQAVTGVDEKVTTSAIGGATSIELIAENDGTGKKVDYFQLAQDPQSGLWSGVLSFSSPGEYHLVAHSIDGAGNVTDRTVLNMNVLPAAKVMSAKTDKLIIGAKATVYYRDPDSNSWVVWAGAAYGQQNPQVIKKGNLNLLVPAGTYYLKVTAAGYKPIVSQSFTTQKSLAITTPLDMSPQSRVHIGPISFPLPNWSVHTVKVVTTVNSTATSSSLVGQPFPNFSLTNTTGQTENDLNLTGKPALVTILSTWSPTVSEQLTALADLQKNHNITVMPIFVQDDSAKVTAYLQSAGYNLTAVADPSGTLVTPLQISELPTHFIVDQNGNIKKVMVGVLSESDLLNAIAAP